MLYLLRQDTLDALRRAEPNSVSTDQLLAYEAKHAVGGSAPRNLAATGDVAEISIEGVLTPNPDLLAKLFGGGNTAYRDIKAALRSAQSDPSVKRVVLNIDSPGGTVAGLFETIDAIKSFKASGKKLTVSAAMACSAAYALAAAAGPIEAVSEASMFGSIGVVTSIFVSDRVVDVTSTDAPNKRPDVRTEQGRAVVRAELDEIHSLFVRRIADGRNTSPDKVSANYGKGSTFLATEAKRRGMIDTIGGGEASGVGASMAVALQLVADLKGSAAPKLSFEERARIVADIVCGPERKAPAVDIVEAKERHVRDDNAAETVADIVCGRKAAPSRESSHVEERSDAVANFVTEMANTDWSTTPISGVSERGGRTRVQ